MRGAVSLKTIPPRPSKGFQVRAHLALDRFRHAGVQIIEISAPHGFGKTSQLGQWAREAEVAGVTPIWLTLDESDDTSRLIQGLTYSAMRTGNPRAFSSGFAEWIGSCTDPQQALTGWLAAIAQSPGEALLLLDDVDLAPETSRSTAIDYLLANASGNLIIAFSSRPHSGTPTAMIHHHSPMIRLTARELRMRENETREIIERSLPDANAIDLAVRIQALTDGWPLGVRFAIASQLRKAEADDFSLAATADLGQYFLTTVLDRLPPESLDMLVGIACLAPISPALCGAALDIPPPTDELYRLADESPILTRAADENWLWLHPAAQDILMTLHERLPQPEQRLTASRAARWYADHGLMGEAAEQARRAGDDRLASQYAEVSLRQMTQDGRNSEVLEWFSRISQVELGNRPGYWAPAAWAFALSDRYEDANALARRIIARDGASAAELFEAQLIQASIAGYRDDLATLEEVVTRWGEAPPMARKGEIVLHLVHKAHIALLNGRTEDSRLNWNQTGQDSLSFAPISRAFADLTVGMSYLWEGKPLIAREQLAKALVQAESQMDRSNRGVSMLAAALAQACLELGQLDEARLHLALRTPVVEKHGLPDTVVYAFCTLAAIAEADGRQDQAAAQLNLLIAEGRKRGAIRMICVALGELVSLHSRNGRDQSAQEAHARLESAIADHRTPLTPGARDFIHLCKSMSQASMLVHMADPDMVRPAVAIAADAEQLAYRLNRVGDVARAQFLRAIALTKMGDAAAIALAREAVSLCRSGGLYHLHARYAPFLPAQDLPSPEQDNTQPAPDTPVQDGRSILTPREHDILLKLAKRLTNKEIALSMGVGEETVKWHLKNLFQKLETGDRKTVVKRAEALGLL